MSKTIDGIKLIKHNAGGVNEPDDPSYPWRLDVSFRPAEFMNVAAIMLYGNKQIVVRGKTQKALEEFIKANDFRDHPRLLSCEITQTK